jgi:hypothetical protein
MTLADWVCLAAVLAVALMVTVTFLTDGDDL